MNIQNLKNLSNTKISIQAPGDKVTTTEHREVNDAIINAIASSVPFSTTITFNSMHTAMPQQLVTSILTFTNSNTDNLIGGGTLVKLIANGTNIPNLAAFKKSTNSSDYNNTSGIINCLYFFYDGTDYWVNIWQEQNQTPIDVVAPLLTSAIIENSNQSKIILTYNEVLNWQINPSIADYSVINNTINAVNITGNYTIEIIVDTPFTIGEVVTIDYTAGSNKVQDIAGNLAANLTNQAVVNNITADVIFNQLGSGVTFNNTTKVLSSNANQSGAYDNVVKNITNGFELSTLVTSDAAVLLVDTNIDNNYLWDDTQTALFAFNKYAGNIGILDMRNGGILAGTAPVLHSAASTDNYIRVRKSGNDAIFERSANGTTWTLLATSTGMFTGISNVYIKAIFATTAFGNLNLKAQLKLS